MDAQLVLDPVLLHERSFFEDIAVLPQEEPYILLYYVMELAADSIKNAVKYAQIHHMRIVEITDTPLKQGQLSGYKDIDVSYVYPIGVEEWLGYIMNAEYIFTNSFHCCCFSILFGKQFFAGSRNGDKVNNLLQTFQLSDRKVDDTTDMTVYLKKNINYTAVNSILEEKRAASAEFILSGIKSLENRQRPIRDYTSFKKKQKYKIYYNSRAKAASITWTYDVASGKAKRLPSGTCEYIPAGVLLTNDGNSNLQKNQFRYPGYRFVGWHIRVKIDNRWFWYLEDGSLKEKNSYKKHEDPPIGLLKEKSKIPYLNVNHISVAVAEAVWKKTIWRRAVDKAKRTLRK